MWPTRYPADLDDNPVGVKLLRMGRRVSGVMDALPRAHNLLRMEILHGRSLVHCYEPGVTAINETNVNPMNSQP